jgi:anti-anti-sigma regulatory factor
VQEPCALPAELTIYSVGEWAPRLRAALAATTSEADPDPLRLDAAAVEEVDAAGVQLLLSLANALQRDARSLQLLQPSAPLARACSALGAEGLLS